MNPILSRPPEVKSIWKIKDRTLTFSRCPLIMAILNVTPDSFSDGGEFLNKEKAIERAISMVEEGADILDIGGMSTRPGAEEISEEEELRRVVEVVQALSHRIKIPISIDTYRSKVAEQALEAGAHIVNDVSALTLDSRMASVVQTFGAGLVLMHMRGTPQTMQKNLHYENLLSEISEFLKNRLKIAGENGIAQEQIVVDPGLGFGKSFEQNLEILRNLEFFKSMERPLLIGPSRKSFIGHILDNPPEKRLWGTLASVAACFYRRVNIVRVHDVRSVFEFLKVLCEIEK